MRNLSIRFRTPRGPVLALRNVNVAVPRGSVIGLVGESGSGKSTLALAVMRLMAGNATITGGSLDFAGRDLLGLNSRRDAGAARHRLSMVFQDPMTSLNPVRAIGLQMLDIQYRERQPLHGGEAAQGGGYAAPGRHSRSRAPAQPLSP